MMAKRPPPRRFFEDRTHRSDGTGWYKPHRCSWSTRALVARTVRESVDSDGLRIAVAEWGDPEAPPVLLAHGGFDFVRTFDVFAPLLADGGWRIVAWDQRGHGDSEHAALYHLLGRRARRAGRARQHRA